MRLFAFQTIGPNGAEYSFRVDLTELVENGASFDLRATRSAAGGLDAAAILLRATLEEGILRLRAEDGAEFAIRLDVVEIADAEDKDLSGEPDGGLWQTIKNAAGDDEAISQLIDAIPAGDPFLGCLLRAGVSTFVGQVVKCTFAASDAEGWRQTVRQVLACLRRNGVRMLVRTALRAARCWIKGGAPDVEL